MNAMCLIFFCGPAVMLDIVPLFIKRIYLMAVQNSTSQFTSRAQEFFDISKQQLDRIDTQSGQ